MGGLDAQATAATPTQAMNGDGTDYAPFDSPGANPDSVESHLDSFFAGSGWTREDVELVLQVASTAILLYWAYVEVSA